MLNSLFDFCCAVMSQLSDLFGVTYGYLNMLFFYIIQPIIYMLILLWEVYVLWKQNKVNKWVLVIPVLFLVLQSYILIRDYAGADLTSLCTVKIESMTHLAHSVGWSYEFFNLFAFIFVFITVLFLHLLFLLFRKSEISWLIFFILMCLSPYLTNVFFT